MSAYDWMKQTRRNKVNRPGDAPWHYPQYERKREPEQPDDPKKCVRCGSPVLGRKPASVVSRKYCKRCRLGIWG